MPGNAPRPDLFGDQPATIRAADTPRLRGHQCPTQRPRGDGAAAGAWRYEPDAYPKLKRHWEHGHAGFVGVRSERIGKCPAGMGLDEAQALLDEAERQGCKREVRKRTSVSSRTIEDACEPTPQRPDRPPLQQQTPYAAGAQTQSPSERRREESRDRSPGAPCQSWLYRPGGGAARWFSSTVSLATANERERRC